MEEEEVVVVVVRGDTMLDRHDFDVSLLPILTASRDSVTCLRHPRREEHFPALPSAANTNISCMVHVPLAAITSTTSHLIPPSFPIPLILILNAPSTPTAIAMSVPRNIRQASLPSTEKVKLLQQQLGSRASARPLRSSVKSLSLVLNNGRRTELEG